MSQLKPHKIWDIPIRLFHWTLVFLIALLWVTGEFGGLDVTVTIPVVGDSYLSNMDIHALAGQGIFILIVFRLLWGVWGSTTARFSHFVRKPSMVLAELSDVVKGRLTTTNGHNPVGGLMVVVLLLLLGMQAITGMFSADDTFFEGPLTHWVSEAKVKSMTALHHLIFSLLQVLIIMHILAIIFYLLRGHNLISAMITGKRIVAEAPPLSFPSGWLALVSLLVAFAVLVLIKSI